MQKARLLRPKYAKNRFSFSLTKPVFIVLEMYVLYVKMYVETYTLTIYIGECRPILPQRMGTYR